MSTFAEVVKYLRRSKSRKATDADLQTSGTLTNPLKYNGTLTKSRAITYVPEFLVIPAFSTNTNASGEQKAARLVRQYNYSMAQDFYLLGNVNKVFNTGNTANTLRVLMCIKYRIGSTVYRYKLYTLPADEARLNFPLYNGELIKKNFCIEMWRMRPANPGNVWGLLQAATLRTSILRLPTTPDDLGSNIIMNAPLAMADFAVALPEILPYTQDNQVWLDNV